jgi:16S rRNA (adenine1518-N6/adenine1519-N6)-dimethyltransferase
MANDFIKYDIKASKRLGQNFLVDRNISNKIIRQINLSHTKILLEIGPGLGSLTELILEMPTERVIVVEYDRNCLNYLHELGKKYPKLEILHMDALKVDEIEFIKNRFIIVSNLPYNISVILTLKWLDISENIDHMVLMFQKEVAERITAKPCTKSYGAVSIFIQYLCDAIICFDVPPTCFSPAPKVTSSVVKLIPKKDITERLKIYQNIKTICNKTFNQRRKMLRNTLKDLFPNPKLTLESIGLHAEMRPEELSVENFATLAEMLKKDRL